MDKYFIEGKVENRTEWNRNGSNWCIDGQWIQWTIQYPVAAVGSARYITGISIAQIMGS